jgi:hypothetical protein
MTALEYWDKNNVATIGYPEGITTHDYHPYGNTDASTAISVD